MKGSRIEARGRRGGSLDYTVAPDRPIGGPFPRRDFCSTIRFMSQPDCVRGRDRADSRLLHASSAESGRKRDPADRRLDVENDGGRGSGARGTEGRGGTATETAMETTTEGRDRSVRTIAKEIIAASFRPDKRPLYTVISMLMFLSLLSPPSILARSVPFSSN